MSLQLSILNTSDVPIYKQLYEQVAFQIIRGELSAGSPLPPIRQVALSLGISVISIKRAWEELERDGYIVTMVGRGCFAADLTPDDIADKRRQLASAELRRGCAVCRSLGMSREEAVRLVSQLYGDS